MLSNLLNAKLVCVGAQFVIFSKFYMQKAQCHVKAQLHSYRWEDVRLLIWS